MSGVVRAVFGMGVTPMFGVGFTGGLNAGIVMHMVWCNRCDAASVSVVTGDPVAVIPEVTHSAARTGVAESLAACALSDVRRTRGSVVNVASHVDYSTPPLQG